MIPRRAARAARPLLSNGFEAMNKDVVSGLALLVFDAAYFWATQKIQVSMLDDPFGARGLPHILALLLAILALIIIVRGLVAARAAPAAVAPAEEVGHQASLPRALGLLLIGVGYMLMLPVVGYAVGVTLLIAAIAFYEGAGRDWRIPAAAVFGGLLFWSIFNLLLGVGQPTGMLFGG